MRLSDGWMIFVLLAFALYVVLDGYDLGIGVLTLLERDDRRRRAMYELVATAWDGNESWLVLLGLTIWGGLPLAYGVVLPSLYIPLILMLWSLIWRGVSIELLAQHEGWHPRWGKVFGFGSLLAGFCQGAAFGGLVAGVSVRGGVFAGGPFSFLHHGYAALAGLTALALYTLAATAWVYLKSDGDLQARVGQIGRIAVVVLAAGTAACWALLSAAGSTTLHPGAGARLPLWIVGAVVLAAGLGYAYRAFVGRADAAPVYATLAVYAGGLTLVLALLYPHIVPPDITVHEAASPRSSLLFLLIGVGLFIPVVLTYQTFAYWIFRGKLRVREEATTT
jgi:cytochrome d ubiquinol oxidase subunit II